MKTLITSCLIILVTIMGQTQPAQKEEPLLTAYYAVKDALVGGDENLASAKANELVKELNAFPASRLDKKSQELKEKIKSDASKIAVGPVLSTWGENRLG